MQEEIQQEKQARDALELNLNDTSKQLHDLRTRLTSQAGAFEEEVSMLKQGHEKVRSSMKSSRY